jgi:hypothetical protein
MIETIGYISMTLAVAGVVFNNYKLCRRMENRGRHWDSKRH